MPAFEFVEPRSLEEALERLDSDDPGIRPFGGGTALMLMMKEQFFTPVRLVALRRIEGLRGVSVGADRLRIGAMTTFSDLHASDAVFGAAPVLRRTMRTLANLRVRNVATVGGNLAHGDPHLDLPPVWSALGADARILGPSGERGIAVEHIAKGYGETRIEAGEILTRVDVPIVPDRRCVYVKVTTRAIHDWPALGLALACRTVDGVIVDPRFFLSAAVDRPFRLSAAEAEIAGRRPDSGSIRRAAEAAAESVDLESDARGSGDYKTHLLRVHLARGLHELFGTSA